ncbi:MAG: hypothetical protein CMH98_10450 [Oceanospirillaceae bacterium]|nr:hypothetical protein [Oceanospirillaceae bacterium]
MAAPGWCPECKKLFRRQVANRNLSTGWMSYNTDAKLMADKVGDELTGALVLKEFISGVFNEPRFASR